MRLANRIFRQLHYERGVLRELKRFARGSVARVDGLVVAADDTSTSIDSGRRYLGRVRSCPDQQARSIGLLGYEPEVSAKVLSLSDSC